MTNLTLRQLRYFDALARHLHFGKAATASAISQPALSLQIRDLEVSLGLPLLDRSARQLQLTPFGEAFSLRARAVLNAVEELDDFARAERTDTAGRLRLGTIPTVAPYLLPSLAGLLATHFPGLDLRLRETQTPRLLEELGEGRLDAAILALPVSEPGLREVALLTEDFLLVRPRSEADQPVPDRDLLQTMRLLLLEEGHCLRDQALGYCNLDASSPRKTLDASSLSTLVQMVGAGLGVTLIPEMAAAVETRSANVCLSRFAEPQPRRTIGMVWRQTSPLAERLEHIAGVLRQGGQGAHSLTTTDHRL